MRIVELAFGSVKVLNDVVGPVNCVKAFPSANVRIVAALNTLRLSLFLLCIFIKYPPHKVCAGSDGQSAITQTIKNSFFIVTSLS